MPDPDRIEKVVASITDSRDRGALTENLRRALATIETPDAGQGEMAQFLIDVATATAERIDSEDRLRQQQLRLQSLGTSIRGLTSALTDSTNHDDTRVSEFAAAAALLTDRERDILQRILEGASNASIAETYTLSVETVKTHVKHILRKMGVANRAELIARSV